MHLGSRSESERWTFGLLRAEVLSAALNWVMLVVVAALVATEAARRLIAPTDVQPVGVIVARRSAWS